MTSKWSEIRNEFVLDTDDKYVAILQIDAWKSDDENEEGSVIATVKATKGSNSNNLIVNYIDNDAKTDTYAQEIINEGMIIMNNHEFD